LKAWPGLLAVAIGPDELVKSVSSNSSASKVTIVFYWRRGEKGGRVSDLLAYYAMLEQVRKRFVGVKVLDL
jgi:hypothetical protein